MYGFDVIVDGGRGDWPIGETAVRLIEVRLLGHKRPKKLGLRKSPAPGHSAGFTGLHNRHPNC